MHNTPIRASATTNNGAWLRYGGVNYLYTFLDAWWRGGVARVVLLVRLRALPASRQGADPSALGWVRVGVAVVARAGRIQCRSVGRAASTRSRRLVDTTAQVLCSPWGWSPCCAGLRCWWAPLDAVWRRVASVGVCADRVGGLVGLASPWRLMGRWRRYPTRGSGRLESNLPRAQVPHAPDHS